MNHASRIVIGFLFSLLASNSAWSTCTAQPIDFGDTRNGIIATDACQNMSNNTIFYYDSYVFNGVAGQKIAVSMNTTSTIDPFLFLVSPDKTFVSDNNSGGGLNARIPSSGFLTLTQTGTYEIQAVTAVALTTGSYTLSLTSSTPAACNVAANPQSSATLPVASGTPVTISAACGSGAAPITFTWDNGAFVGGARNVTPTATTTYNIVATNANGSSPPFSITVFVSAPAPGVPTVEFYNINLGHYFVTAVQAEATAIDNGSAGPGWVRTGFSYDVYNGPVTQGAISTAPVCRFYGTPGVGPNSHFYTVDANECAAVKKDPGWFYEGIAYHIQPPVNGACPTGTHPIFRAYNNRAAQNDSNHRFINNKTTFLQMNEQAWTLEGLVMCTTSVRAPTPVTGGTFKDGPSGAGVTIANGQIPKSTNAIAPGTRPATNVPPEMTDPAQGDVNVTSGALGYTFNLTGDTGFTTTTPGAVNIALPFNASAVPTANLTSIKVLARLYDPNAKAVIDLTGSLAVNGAAGMLSVETRGLPRQFTASVIYNPNMDSATSDQSVVAAALDAFNGGASSILKGLTSTKAKTTWPAQAWCIIYNPVSPTLIASVKTILGLTGNPTQAQIRSVLIDKVGLGARKAQTAFENDGHVAPNLIVATTCGGATPRYNIHMESEGSGIFVPNDPGEVLSGRDNHYGRLYTDNERLDDATSTMLGSVLASIAHEMHHASQSSQGLITGTTKGYVESAAALFGKTIDNNGVVKGRPGEVHTLSDALMEPLEQYRYNNQDFFAYVARNYNGGNLGYLTGLYVEMQKAIAGNDEPDPPVSYAAMDTFFRSAFSGQSLPGIYLDYVRQRALTHNQASVMGHPGEVTSGFAANLFDPFKVKQHPVDVSNCSAAKISGSIGFIDKFATAAVVVTATGTVPTNSAGPTLTIKLIPDSSSIGALWSGWTYRASTATAIGETSKFTGFGKQGGEKVVLLLSNLDPASDHGIQYEITCGGIKIDALSPVRGKVGDVMTISGSGFGAANDSRSVTLNGTAVSPVTYVSDTQLKVTIPSNASTGDVIVTVNGDKSNAVNFEVVAQCSATQVPGGDTPDTRTIELGKKAGTFNFTYDTFVVPDRMIVKYETTTLHDSGCVGTNGSVTKMLSYNGNSTSITVQVIPNCNNTTGTAWSYSVSCP